jgi:hypothetical protein
LCAHGWAASNFVLRAEPAVCAAISRWPPDLPIALSRSSETARHVCVRVRTIRKRGAVNGEKGYFGGFSEANELNHDG